MCNDIGLFQTIQAKCYVFVFSSVWCSLVTHKVWDFETRFKSDTLDSSKNAYPTYNSFAVN